MLNKPLINIFIGYDPRESLAYHVLAHSIERMSSMPVSITPIRRHQLISIHKRPQGPTESTEFSITRFLAPFLAEYRGWAIFMDCDMLCRGDISELMDLRDAHYPMMCVQHEYTPKDSRKMLGSVQTRYDKKNWSSMMLLNCPKLTQLTPEYVNKASGLDLHQFKWMDGEIGSLPLEWNWLVGEYDYNPDARLAHFTLGGPWWKNYVVSDYADEWRDELSSLMNEAGISEATTNTKRGN